MTTEKDKAKEVEILLKRLSQLGARVYTHALGTPEETSYVRYPAKGPVHESDALGFAFNLIDEQKSHDPTYKTFKTLEALHEYILSVNPDTLASMVKVYGPVEGRKRAIEILTGGVVREEDPRDRN